MSGDPSTKRPGFREWLDRQDGAEVAAFPLTHIAKAVVAEDIIRSGSIRPTRCEVFKQSLSYFFYGKPSYRVGGDGAIKTEAACPICFIFKPETIVKASSVYPFDTGAFAKRMYNNVILEEMSVEDFQIDPSVYHPNTIVAAFFDNPKDYLRGNTRAINPKKLENWDFAAKALFDLLRSEGRNEPDDRIFSIEVQVEREVALQGNLLAAVVPHTLWSASTPTPWLKTLKENNVEIRTYNFTPNKNPEYYHGLIEAEVYSLYELWKFL